jgi:hypothetical protein
MVSSGLLRRVALVRTDVSEEHGVTTQKTPFFIVTAVKTSNLTNLYLLSILILNMDFRVEWKDIDLVTWVELSIIGGHLGQRRWIFGTKKY